MTNAPADLVAVRKAVMPLIGVTNPADVGIVGDGVHQRTGGYHEGKDVLTTLGIVGSDYSVAEYARDRNGLTDDASAIDITLGWSAAAGGRAAAIVFSNLMVADLRAGTPGTEVLRGINWSPDGTKRQRVDKRSGLAVESSSDSVDIHTHFECWRDTAGQRDGAFLALLRRNILKAQGKAVMTDTDIVNILRLVTNADSWGLSAVTGQAAHYLGGDGKQAVTSNALHDKLNLIVATTAADLAEDKATTAAINALVASIAAGGGNIDSAPILAAIAQVRAEESSAVQALQQQLAAALAKLAAAAQAEATALAK